MCRSPIAGPSGTLIQTDNTTEGNWIGTYGTQGYDLADGQASLPSYASVSFPGASIGTWASTTTDPRGLEDAGGSGRTAAIWDCHQFLHRQRQPDRRQGALPRQLHHRLGQHGSGRSRSRSSTRPPAAVLSTQTVTSFAGGDYLQCAISGDVEIKVTKEGGAFANLTGVFLDASPSTPADRHELTSASLVGTNTTHARQLDRHLRQPGLRPRRRPGQPALLTPTSG